jgi:hypothetical protein
VELQQKLRKIFAGSWQLCLTSSFRFFEKYTTGISVSPHHIPGTANGHGYHEKFEDLYRSKLVNFILEAIQESPLMSLSAAKEVSISINLLQAFPFYCQQLAKSRRCRIRQIVKITSYWKCSMSEIMKSFPCLGNSLQC